MNGSFRLSKGAERRSRRPGRAAAAGRGRHGHRGQPRDESAIRSSRRRLMGRTDRVIGLSRPTMVVDQSFSSISRCAHSQRVRRRRAEVHQGRAEGGTRPSLRRRQAEARRAPNDRARRRPAERPTGRAYALVARRPRRPAAHPSDRLARAGSTVGPLTERSATADRRSSVSARTVPHASGAGQRDDKLRAVGGSALSLFIAPCWSSVR